jgi:tRNA 2-thiocytidine biosynthesis protein TtcA
MLHEWNKTNPGRIESIFTAMQNVVPSHLADGQLFDFANLQTGEVIDGGDIALDKPEFRDPVFEQEEDDNSVKIQPIELV